MEQERIAVLESTEVIDINTLQAEFSNIVLDSIALEEKKVGRYLLYSIGFNSAGRPIVNLRVRQRDFVNDMLTVRITTKDYNTIKAIYDTFVYTYDPLDTNYVLTGDNVLSPNGLLRSRYHGAFQGNPADVGQVGVRTPAAPTGGFTNVLYEFPYTAANPSSGGGYWTSASFVTTEKPNYFRNFDMTVWVRTVAQKRTVPNAWETAGILFRFNEAGFPAGSAGTNFHHYYLALKSNDTLELGRKDNTKSIDEQYFLSTGVAYNFTLNQWNKVRIKAEFNHIEVWIDDVKKIDFIDDGHLPLQTTAPNTPTIPSELMGSGLIGFYNEDAIVEFSPMTILELL
jgi:hypothetical protein